MKRSQRQRLAAAVAGVGLSLVMQSYSRGAVNWIGPTTDDLWSNDANWGGTPVSGQDVIFDNAGAASAAGVVTSTVNADTTINSLLYSNTGTTSFHTTQINSGVTLTITGNNALRVGMITPTTSVNTNVAITGGGTLNVNAPTGTFAVTNDNVSGTSTDVLDMHGLATFNANVTNFLVGTKVDGSVAAGLRTLGNLTLADTNTITAATAIIGWDGTNNRPSALTLGRVNTFNVDTFHVAREKTGVVTMQFGAGLTDATMTLRGKAGGNTRTNFTVNDFSAQSTSTTNSGQNVVDFRGGTLDAMIETLTLAVGQSTTGSGSANAVLYFSKGNLDVNTVILGKTTSTTAGAAAATGTLNISGGTVRATNIILASQTSAATATGILNITGGLVKVTGDITDGNGTGASTLFIDGGTVDMKPAGDTVAGNVGTTTNRIDNFRVNGILTNAGNISVSTISGTGTISNFTGTLTVNNAANVAIANQVSGGTGSILGMNGGGTMSFANGGTLTNIGGFNVLGNSKIDLTSLGGTFNAAQSIIGGSGTLVGTVNLLAANGTITPGGGTASAGTLSITGALNANTNAKLRVDLSDNAAVTSDLLNVGGNLTLSAGTLEVTPLGALTPGAKIRVVNYTGTKTGSFSPTVTSNSRYTFTVDESTDKQVNVVVGGSNASLVWKGGGGNIWDVVNSPNWNNNTEKFYQADAVTFDDTGNGKTVTVSDALFPASVVVNSGTNYTFTGGGRIGGSAGITKGGAGTLAMNLTGGNDFSGAVNVNAGTFVAGSATALGNTNGATVVAAGATLDVNAQNLGAEVVTVGGAGVNGLGAIVNNSATGQNNALRFVNVSSDTTIGGVGRWDIRANSTATLNMGGFNLTKIGAAQNSLVGVAVSNPGNINVNQGTFSIESTTTLGGSAANKVNVNAATLQLFGLTTAPAWTLNLADSTLRINNGTTNAWLGPVSITGTNIVDVTATNIAHAFNGPISGTGSINKTSVGPLTLNAANTYTGTTTITGGTLKLGAAGSIAATPLIDIKAGATFDVSAVTGGFVLGGAQTLQGSGIVVGNFTDSPGAKISPGGAAAVGTLSFSNSASFNGGGTLQYNLTDSGSTGGTSNDLITIGGNLALAGLTTIEVNPLAALTSPYVIMTYTGTKTGDAATNLKVVSASRYTFALDDSQANQISLNVTGGSAASLDWVGGNTTLNWDSVNPDQTGGTPNWKNTSTSAADRFFQADTVHFGDSPNNTVTLVGALQPTTIKVDGQGTDYTFVGAGKISGGTLNLSSGRKLIIANTGINDSAATVNITNGSTLQIGTGGTAGNLGTGNISNDANLVFNRSDTVTVPNLLSGSGTYEQRGPGLLIVSNAANTFNGTMAVTGGTLKPTAAGALGNGSVVVSNGGTLDVNGLNFANRTFTFSGAGVGGLGAIVNTGAAQQNAFLNVTLAGDTTIGGDVRFDIRSNTNTTASLNTNGQPVKLTKVGLGQFSLVGVTVDNGLGDIDVQNGIFSVETSTSSLGAVDNTLSIAKDAVLQFWATTTPLSKKIAFNGGTIRVGSGTGANNNVFNGPVSVNAPSFIDTNGGNLIYGGTLSGTNTLTKIGASGNTLTLNGDGNQFTGAIVSNAGTITVARNGALGTSTASVTLNNTTATFGGTGTRLNLTGDITVDAVPLIMNSTLSGTGEQRTSLTSTSSATGANTWNGPISVIGISPTGLSNDAGSLIVNGNVSGPHTGTFFLRGGAGTGFLNGKFNVPGANLFKTDNGSWVIASTGNTAAAMGVAVGTLRTDVANALPPTAILTMGQTSDSASPTLDLNGFDQTVGGLAVLAVGGSKRITNLSAASNTPTLTVNVAATNATSFGGFGLITGNLALTKAGPGSQALTSAQAYTGATTVTGGTLSVSGSIATSSGVTVSDPTATFEAASAQTVKALTVTGGKARVVNAAKVALTVGDGTATASPLTLTGGTLDLTTNGVAIHYAAAPENDAAVLASTRAQLIAGYGAGGDWKGATGITSSSIGSLNAVGYALASDVLPFANGATTDTFLGTTVDKSTVLARYTLSGDLNLDGAVDFLDLARLAQSYNVTDGTRQWVTGDINYDGKTDFLDLAKMAQNYNTALPTEPIPGAPADFQADLARAFAAVPEPGTLGLFAVGGIALLSKRRRRA